MSKKKYIKNPHIIHMIEDLRWPPYSSKDPGVRYLCIHACYPTPEKSTRDESKVTCQNCLRAIRKKNRSGFPKPGTYQTTIVTETWVIGRTKPRVQYRTTFGGEVIEHNSILELVRALHAEKDGKASALVDALKAAKKLDAIELLKEELEEWRRLGLKESDAKADPHDVLIRLDDRLTNILEAKI